MKWVFITLVTLVVFVLIYRIYVYRTLVYSKVVGYVSSDKTTPFVDISTRPFINELKSGYEDIRQEVINCFDKFSPIQHDLFFDTITKGNEWKKIYLKWYAEAPDYAYKLFPKTMSIIDKYPEIRLAMFSRLDPGAKITPHAGHFRGCLRIHFSIITPNSPYCFIDVDGQKYYWKDGEIIAFDDTYLHYVENNTSQSRVILFLDVERKFIWSIFKHLNDLLMDRVASKTSRVNSELLRQ